MRRRHGKDDRPAGSGGVASSLGNNIKEKRKGWRETNQSNLKKIKIKIKIKKLYGQNHKFNDKQTMPYNMNKKSKEKK